jgi:hypothetical protein
VNKKIGGSLEEKAEIEEGLAQGITAKWCLTKKLWLNIKNGVQNSLD